jgi:hypothetical protein
MDFVPLEMTSRTLIFFFFYFPFIFIFSFSYFFFAFLLLLGFRQVASAYWLDVMAKVQYNTSTTTTAAGILYAASQQNPPALATLIVYDLPNRDCHAKASNGEICCTYNPDGTCDYDAGGDCADGINT